MSDRRRMASRSWRRLVATGTAVILTVGGLSQLTAPADAATRCSSGVPGDVNGDGYAEVAVSSREPQAVHVFYGSRSGLRVNAKGSARDDQLFTQDTKGIPGAPGRDESWGRSTTFGDFDGDGCADLAIGAPDDYLQSGTVTILYGTPQGLSTARVTQIIAIESLPEDWSVDEFGYQLGHGDVTGDGVDDLLVSVPTAIENGSDLRNTTLVVYTGGSGGLSTDTNRRIPITGEDVGGGFDTSIKGFAVGDFDGNGSGELAVSANGITLITLAADRIASYRPGVIRQGGNQLVAGDTNGDGRDDLAYAYAPAEEQNGVTLVLGSAGGLTPAGSRQWLDRDLGVSGDYGSLKLAMGRLDSGSTVDLVVAGQGTTVGKVPAAGALTVLFGGAGGLTPDRSQHVSEATSGVPGSPSKWDRFGASVTASVVQGGTQASLVVGAPNESTKKTSSGRFYFFPRGASGAATASSGALSLDTAGVKGRSVKNGILGLAVGGQNSWGLTDD